MDSVNDEILTFQNNIEQKDTQVFANYVNVFMARGIFTNLTYPFGYHASTGLSGDQLTPLIWEATRILELIGFNVRAWTSDGASPNRKCFDINAGKDSYFTENPFSIVHKKIYFFSDVPHLLKTTRNNLENSHGNKNTKALHVSFKCLYTGIIIRNLCCIISIRLEISTARSYSLKHCFIIITF